MKRFLYSYIAAACLLATACTPQGGDTAASLDVSPTSLAFGAEDATTQTVDVTATGGVEWKHIVPSSADWITVDDKTPGKLTVSVSRNPNAEKRTASITIKPTNNDDVKTKSVTVTQQGNENPEVYSLAIDPDTALTFAAEGAPAQTVKVTATGEGIAWSAAVEDAAKEWITLSATEGGEGETSLAITVKDNPDTAQRTANITLTTNNATITPKAIRVTQEAKVLPASFSMTYNDEELPEERFSLHYKGEIQYDIDVFPVNLEWNLKTEYEIGGAGWLEARKVETENIYKIHIQCNPNQREKHIVRGTYRPNRDHHQCRWHRSVRDTRKAGGHSRLPEYDRDRRRSRHPQSQPGHRLRQRRPPRRPAHHVGSHPLG